MSCVRVGVVVSCVHDVMYSGSEVGSGYGRGSELSGSVSSGKVGSIPGAVVVHVLYRW